MSLPASLPPGVPPAEPAARRARLREGLGVWALAFGLLLVARWGIGPMVPWVGANLKAVAVLGFLYLPLWLARRRGEGLADYGLTLAGWRSGVAWGLGTSLVVLPAFALLFWGAVVSLDHLPEGLVPYASGPAGVPALRLPPQLGWLLVSHLLVVALPEELFYRGWLYARLSEGLDEPRRGRWVAGAWVGPAFWLTAALFAVGHLAEPYPWRLATFFPGLLFGWLRVRSGGLLAPILFHGLSNVWIVTLEASFFGLQGS